MVSSSPVITNNFSINNNLAQYGGGIFVGNGSSPNIKKNNIKNNVAIEENGGGGIFVHTNADSPNIGGTDEIDTDNFNNICGNSPDQIKSNTGTSYPYNDFGYTITLSVNHGDYGIVNGEGNYCGGTQIQIEATPEDGYYFVNWTDDEGNEISTDNPYVFIMPVENVSINASFEISKT